MNPLARALLEGAVRDGEKAVFSYSKEVGEVVLVPNHAVTPSKPAEEAEEQD